MLVLHICCKQPRCCALLWWYVELLIMFLCYFFILHPNKDVALQTNMLKCWRLVCSGAAACMLTLSCLLIINNTQTPICGRKQLSGSVGFFFHAFPLFLHGNSVGMLERSSVQYMIVCVCLPGEISCLGRSQRGWQMTTRSLVSLICDPLWRHKHTSREFPAPFLSFCLIRFLSSSPLLCYFPPLASSSSSRTFFLPPSVPHPLSSPLRSWFSLFFLLSVSLLHNRSPAASLSLFLFPTVLPDFPADWGDYCIIARC